MKICLFSGDITRDGGTERVGTLLANALQGQHIGEASIQVFVLSLTEAREETVFPLDASIQREHLSDHWIQPGIGYLPMISKVRQYVKTHGIHLLIDIDLVLDVLSVPATAGLRTKVISWSHFSVEGELRIPYRRFILKHFTTRTQQLVTLTEQYREAMEAYTNGGVPVRTIPNPVWMSEGEPAFEVEKNPWILSVGHIVWDKGFDMALKVAKQVLPKHPKWHWYILGDGDQREFLVKEIKACGLEEQMHMVGYQKDVEVWLRQGAIFVNTSRVEGFPMSMIEAEMAGLPLVAFDICEGNRQLVKTGETGYLIPSFHLEEMGQSIEMLMADGTARKKMGQRAYEAVQVYKKEEIIPKWMHLIEEIL